MTTRISTGIVSHTTSNKGSVTRTQDTTPSELIIFPVTEKAILVVEPGTMMVITAYNLNFSSRVEISKILRSNGVPAQGDGSCCPSITVSDSIRLQSVVLPCWRLDSCNPIFVIKTPGSYEIDVIGAYIDVVVTASSYKLQDVNDFSDCRCGYNSDFPFGP